MGNYTQIENEFNSKVQVAISDMVAVRKYRYRVLRTICEHLLVILNLGACHREQ